MLTGELERDPFRGNGHPPVRDPAAGPAPAADPAPAAADSAPRAVITAVRVSQERATPELAVHLLGPLHVAVDDVAVEDWPSARCRSLFGYLLTHREPWPTREALTAVFWQNRHQRLPGTA